MAKPTHGDLIATGRTSDVYEFGPGAVVKVPRLGVPGHWAAAEAAFSDVISSLGLPAPRVRSLVEVDGRLSIVFDRVDGPSMWELMCADPAGAPELAVMLAATQRRIHSAGLVAGVPCFAMRTAMKIAEVPDLPEDERVAATRLVATLPSGAALLHGDLHPGNVLMSPDGPMVIDWFDAAIGHPIADVARTSLLLRSPESGVTPEHLTGGPAGVLESVRAAYLEAIVPVIADREAMVADWEGVIAIGRLAEGAGDDREELLTIWRSVSAADHSLHQARQNGSADR